VLGPLDRLWRAGSPHGPSSLTGTLEAQRLESAITSLDLPPDQIRSLVARYVEEIAALDRAAAWNVKVHQSLRTLAASAGLIAPALLGIGMADSTNTAIRWVAFGFTLVSGLALAADAVFRPRDRWRLQRRVGDALKAEAWLYIQLAGPYEGAHRPTPTRHVRSTHGNYDGARTRYTGCAWSRD
jgi:hypothetical protein